MYELYLVCLHQKYVLIQNLCVFLFSPCYTGNKICSVVKNKPLKLLQMCPNQMMVYRFRMKKLKNCARSLFRRMHRARPDKNLLLAKTQSYLCSISRILHLQENIVTEYGGGIIPRGKERICLQGHHFYRTTWTLCAK